MNPATTQQVRQRVLVIGGGDVGSAVACNLFRRGVSVLIAERSASTHARRGMAFIDALFDGEAVLDGVRARCVADVAEVLAAWSSADVIPLSVQPERQLAEAIGFDAVIEATMRRWQTPPDLRALAAMTIGLGPGFAPGINCHLAVETQWGTDLGRVLRDRPAADRSGGPRALAGITRERFVSAPANGTWKSNARLGQPVRAGDEIGLLGGMPVCAPLNGYLRGVTRDGVQVQAGQCLLEVDPRAEPDVFGLGERPRAVARGVLEALGLPGAEIFEGNH